MSVAKNNFDEVRNEEASRKAEWRKHVVQVTEKLEADIGSVIKDKKVLGLGSFGLVVDNTDGTATKIFLRDENKSQEEQTALFDAEIDSIKRLSGLQFGTAKTAVLYETQQFPNSKEAYASYRMTNFTGHEIDWGELIEDANADDIEKHFRSAGKVLGHFHVNARPVLTGISPPEKGLSFGTQVATVPGLDTKVNEALSVCNNHLQENMKAGINHGDFHPLNFKVNDNGEITGLFDTSYAGETGNYLTDLAMVPDEGITYAVDAYQSVTGEIIDPDMVTLTQISQDVAVINWHMNNPRGSQQIIDGRLQNLVSRLNKVSEMTGTQFDENQPPVLEKQKVDENTPQAQQELGLSPDKINHSESSQPAP